MDIGTYCKQHRTEVLKKTLHEVGAFGRVSTGTLSAFENGRSNNVHHLMLYIRASNPEQRKNFVNGLIGLVGEHHEY